MNEKFSKACAAALAAFCAMAALPLAAAAWLVPPYALYPMVEDEGVPTPIFFTKVCEPGKSAEEDAAYVILGVWGRQTYQVVSQDYAGGLKIPERLDGLPVRGVMPHGFSLCQKLTDVEFPATLREVGEKAFLRCGALTNVTFSAGLQSVGDYAFSNCVSLASVTFPKTLAHLGHGCFDRCRSLGSVRFLGNAPRLDLSAADGRPYLGENIYTGTESDRRFSVCIDPGTSGWIAPGVRGAPEKWPLDFGWMQAYPVIADAAAEGVEPVPAGFVAVVTEILGQSVAVPEPWTSRFPGYAAKFGSDFAASLLKPTGKVDAEGKALVVWHDYVAGTDPTDPTDVFRATISYDGAGPVISYEPQLAPAEAAKRVYAVYGKARLTDSGWTAVQPGCAGDFNFFKVTVRMR